MYDKSNIEHISIKDAKERRRNDPVNDNLRASSIAFVITAEIGMIDDVTISENAALFPLWRPGEYTAGDIRRDGRELYRCIKDHTADDEDNPESDSENWEKIGDSANEWPEWSPPVSSLDGYDKDAKVTHKGSLWISDEDDNDREPGIGSWTKVMK